MAEQMFHGCWYLDLRSGEANPFAVKAGHRAWVTHAVLVDPASAAAGQSVRVAVRDKTGDEQIRLLLSAERPVAPVQSTVMMDDGIWWLEREDDDSTNAIVRFEGGYVVDALATPETETVEDRVHQEASTASNQQYVQQEEGGEDQEAALEEEEEEGTVHEVTATGTEESDGVDDSSDDEEEESDGESEVSGFMRVDAEDAENHQGGSDIEVLVFYRYTRFSVARSGRVKAGGSTIEHHLIYFNADAGHWARSLVWAGASLAELIYPDGYSEKHRGAWTSLASQASSRVSLPPGAARVNVFVDLGILPQAHCTEARMLDMHAALEDMMVSQPLPTRFAGIALSMPEPVRCAHDENKDGEQKLAKRRRVVATETEEDCSVCYELLKGDDLYAWPGCGKPHVFHGRCLDGVLESKPPCPLCRRGLYPWSNQILNE